MFATSFQKIKIKTMNKYIFIGILLYLITFCYSCDTNKEKEISQSNIPTKEVVIIYDNDVHCAIDGYAQFAAIKDSLSLLTPHVTSVSCGDFAQGDIIGSVSQGEYIIDIMNKVEYDIATLGNHEFDFGINQLFSLSQRLNATTVCCNFRDLRTKTPVFTPYIIKQYDNIKIAYIGFTTTSTSTSTSPLIYQDKEKNIIYDFTQDTFYKQAQYYIDAARADGADYVIALSHLGNTPIEKHPTSINLINHTTGIDAVLDGHSHNIIPDTLIENLNGESILLTSTGTKFQYIGLLTLSTNGKLSSKLTKHKTNNNEIKTFIEKIKEKAITNGNKIIGKNEATLSINNNSGERIIRSQECPLGNFCCDAFRHVLNTDVALLNGGGFRNDLPTGEITYNNLLSLFPFGNIGCTATMTGKQLADILEVSVRMLPEENGSFMQVSGIKFEVDTSIQSPVIMGSDNLYSHVSDNAPHRVSNIQVWDKISNTYKPIVFDKLYTLSGYDYQIKELGSDGIFRYTTLEQDNLGIDIDIIATYIKITLNGTIEKRYNQTEKRIFLKNSYK